MALFDWSPELSVQVDDMDRDHQKLIQLINQLHEAMLARRGNEMLGRILGDLIHYTRTHFTAEEKLMQSHGFPQLAAHKKMHDDLTAQVIALKEQLDGGKVALSLDVMRFLKDWLVQHIQKSDKEYGVYIQRRTSQT